MRTGDDQTADDAVQFLLGFLDRFPIYQDRPFWIAGESYGGVCFYSHPLRDTLLTRQLCPAVFFHFHSAASWLL